MAVVQLVMNLMAVGEALSCTQQRIQILWEALKPLNWILKQPTPPWMADDPD
jgi:hypothetical protein